ncbi:MAG: carbonic anhydrase [Flavobacteriales bacterium]|nr:carbonic anhydrase [Flavobacteriales bacterium]
MLSLFVIQSGCGQKQPHIDHEYELKNPILTLLDGNRRFIENKTIHPDLSLENLQNLNEGQDPFAIILSCSDSRVPPELIFDLGLGDVFVIRNAGNILDDHTLGSIEYAAEKLHTRILVVLGHTKCGAIHAFMEHKNDSIPNHIQSIIDYLKNEPEELELSAHSEHGDSYYEEAVEANVRHVARELKNSEPVLAELVASNRLIIIGAVFNLETGAVSIVGY